MDHSVVEKRATQHTEPKRISRVDDIGGEIDGYQPRLRGTTLIAALGFVAGSGFTLFGNVIFSLFLFPKRWLMILFPTGMTKASCLHC